MQRSLSQRDGQQCLLSRCSVKSSQIAIILLFLLVCLGGGCRRPTEPETDTTPVETGLTLENASIEQADEEGNLVWKIQVVQASYSDDRQKADLEGITGNLYSQGEVVMQVSGDAGEIIENGKKIRLKENVTAIDPRNEAVLTGGQLEWLPDENRVVMAGNLEGKDPNVTAQADQGQYWIEEERLELTGTVEAVVKDPALQIKTSKVFWEIPQKQIVSPDRVEINHFEGETATERVKAQQAAVDLASQTVSLQSEIQLVAVDPPLQVITETALWNLEAETVVINTPVQITHRGEQIAVQGNEGQVDLKNKIIRLRGNVQAANAEQSNRLAADTLTWELQTQGVQAQGNVVYQQTTNPPLTLKGSQAQGNLLEETLQVTGGGNSGPVVTEIQP